MNKSMEHEIYPNDKIISVAISKPLNNIIERILLKCVFPSRSELIRFCVYNSVDKINLIIGENAKVIVEKDINNGLLGKDHPDIIYINRGSKKKYERYERSKNQLDGSNALVSEA